MKFLKLLNAIALAMTLTVVCSTAALAQKGKPQPPPEPPPPADPAIAFNTGLSGDLMVVNADGSNLTKIFAQTVRSNHAPNWSPDGSQLVVMQSAGSYQNWISVVDKDGGNGRDVIPINNFLFVRPAWSPYALDDGNYKILYRDEEGYGVDRQSDQYLVNLDGSDIVNLTRTSDASEMYATWSPTEPARFAALKSMNIPYAPPAELIVYEVVYDAIGPFKFSAVESLNLSADGPLKGTNLGDPAWAKTRDKIAVAAFSDIWIIDFANPYNPVRVFNTPGYSERNPSWSPDDSQIVFTRTPLTTSRKAKPGIFVINTDGTGEKALVNPSDGHALDWRRCCPTCVTACEQ